MTINDANHNAPVPVPSQGSKGMRVQLVTPEMRESAEFYAAGREIDNQLPQNRIEALLNLARLVRSVLDNISERTPEYVAHIHQRWGTLINLKSCIRVRYKNASTSEAIIKLARAEFHEDQDALDFIDEVETSVLSIDRYATVLDRKCRIGTLVRRCFEWHNRDLGEQLMNAVIRHYQGSMNFNRCLRRLYEARRTNACKTTANG